MDASGLRERIKATLDVNASTRQAAEVELKAVCLLHALGPGSGCNADWCIG